MSPWLNVGVGHERLPTVLGWQRPARLDRKTMNGFQTAVAESVLLLTEKPSTPVDP